MRWVEKYRGDTFDQMPPTLDIESLKSHLDSPDREQTFLFEGPAGTGKTTVARIVATLHPNNAGSPIDMLPYREVDMADYSMADNIRSLKEQVLQPPLGVNHITFILDEPQRILPKTQQILLKILENPPSHATLILCTTEPQKIIPEIRDHRCYRVAFKPLSNKRAGAFLTRIAQAEGLKVGESPLTTDICNLVVKLAQGRPRRIVRFLQQAVSGEEIGDFEDEENQKGGSAQLLWSILNQDWTEFKTLFSQVSDPERTRIEMTAILRRTILKQDKPNLELSFVLENLSGMITDSDGETTLLAKCFRATEWIPKHSSTIQSMCYYREE